MSLLCQYIKTSYLNAKNAQKNRRFVRVVESVQELLETILIIFCLFLCDVKTYKLVTKNFRVCSLAIYLIILVNCKDDPEIEAISVVVQIPDLLMRQKYGGNAGVAPNICKRTASGSGIHLQRY
ncbi:MAG: hypothetical protein UX10_C0012G0001 [Candidatus Magasanikbacteria bacterium GW2011_GWA2_45_39]|uniref:Uncharacterized protein n=2 Tax=Candidatus Magasanikiibacteriota TaxID=1752731 RepID=A0A0G1QXE5_9BACT|nr:MAG: hypothetical protein UX10_C0012G0001 [Candidatus Magasanikbacteria bacterium GW2011_GWA2_45_39]KKU13345.1 MAG: hypothetical protein UX20_C0024G0005 [Candidatus Magasanikbacteria bacterium GW2011_GWC2_45_8]